MTKFKILVAGLATLLVVALAGTGSSAQSQSDSTAIEPTVMTQNLYIGVDLNRILLGDNPAEVFATTLASDFPSRATAFAGQVDVERPDVAGLQEVYQIVVFNSEGQTLNNIDYREIVAANLDARGLNYKVASAVKNSDVTLPLDLENGIFARVIDRDVTIYNADTTTVNNAKSSNFTDNFTTQLGGVPIEFTRGYTAVNATINGNAFRFVNVHLEVENVPCATPAGLVICQDSQARELVSELAGEKLPTILVGDFNASDGETAYDTIANAGYVDTWSGGSGFTCCQPELLNNSSSELIERIDVIFYRKKGVTEVAAETATLNAKTPNGLWYSDHAGVVAKLDLDVCDVAVPTLEGNDGSNLIRGTNGNDIIFTYGGNDTIYAKGGDDIICAGNGTNTVVGDAGNDVIIAGDGNDRIYGRDGNDTIDAGNGRNTISGENGDDNITTGNGDDRINGKNGNDTIDAGNGNNIVSGDSGNDTITTGSGTDKIHGKDGNDTVFAGGGNDGVYLGSGFDKVDGGNGNDICSDEEEGASCER